MKKRFGLIGYPLSHSFSKKYFGDKFDRENITDSQYDLFEIEKIEQVDQVFDISSLHGFNVTIPHKHNIMKYMDDFDHSATKVGAVNVVKIQSDGKRIGFNSDYYGFRTSLENWLPKGQNFKALILGIGGAAKAVIAVLNDLNVSFLKISRDKTKGDFSYEDLRTNSSILEKHHLIINTTPLGMSPNTKSKPDIDYSMLNSDYFIYDLIYNPAETAFMLEAKKFGASTKNGLEMLKLQAEKSWEIWNK